MTTLAATPDTIAELLKARGIAARELRKMLAVNRAFRKGRREFLRRGFSPADFQKFTNTIEQHPEYGPVPFPPCIVRAKMAQMERIGKQLAIGKRFLTPAKAS